MEELLKNEAFVNGVNIGINLYQQKIITAHERKEPLIINDNTYYIQDGRERLQDVIDKICR